MSSAPSAVVDGVAIDGYPDWLDLDQSEGSLKIRLRGPLKISTLVLTWHLPLLAEARVLGDAWERGYGDLQWAAPTLERALPWYAVISSDQGAYAVGVKTRPSSFAEWRIDGYRLHLLLDLKCGSRPVALGEREICAAEVIQLTSEPDEPLFAFTHRFCGALCDRPKLPQECVYGINDWYYAYGINSREGVLSDSERASRWAKGQRNRPYSVIDAGWQIHGGCQGGPWKGNERYGNMEALASSIRDAGCKPGIWIRPLLCHEDVPSAWLMRSETLDPSQPEGLEKVIECVSKCAEWGYDLIKHDFTTWDCTGLWGFEMQETRHDAAGGFADDTRTSAEILLSLYDTLRSAAGDSLLLGCNTFGHLAAGTHEIQRTGDDTSGREWERTLKMGVNTLAFRSPQHGQFFAADADCVGITKDIPWALNQQWLSALAHSGTPLFVSADPGAMSPEIDEAVQRAFAITAKPKSVAEPTDWMSSKTPHHWRSSEGDTIYSWTA